MQSAFVVHLVDEAWKILDDVFECFVGHRIDRLDLHGFHEAFGHRVVIRIATPAHRAGEFVLKQGLAIRQGGILRAAIGVMNASGWRLAYLDRGVECGERQANVDRTADRVADGAA